MNRLVLLVWMTIACAAQTTHIQQGSFSRTGSAQFEADAEAVVVHFGGRDWKVGLSRLPLNANDCPDDTEAQQTCATTRAPCLACIKAWEPVAWDEAHKVFYMAAATDTGKNRPWIMFSYDLPSGGIRRIGTHDGGGFNGAAVSPSGRYLAYIGYGVCGVCCTTSNLNVIDTQTRMNGTFELPAADADERPRIIAVRWTGPTTIEYDAQVIRESACREGNAASSQTTATVQVTRILGRR